ncbi:MAG TPA: polysaccharide lyase family 8 super-sandwich domain-containing protein [Candidatus Acidoferrum sp.]|nr:polysaccharide lyase family 8 super-sandwich domain-containing protein [Candidatus Acidoferrum sp.]
MMPTLCKNIFSLVLIFGAVLVVRANDHDTLRLRWCDMLTQGTNANRTNPLYSNWIAELESTGQSYLQTLDTSAGRTNLFYSYRNLATDSSDITTTYERLRAMALAYAVPGSVLETNATLLAEIISGLNWMNANYYNATSVVYDNWYDFEIAVPRALNDTVALLYSNLSPAQINNYMSAVDHFSPTPTYTSISSPVTAYNKVWKSLVVSVRGVIVQDSGKVDLGRTALSDVFPYVKSGEGFYADGSFIFHDEIAYNTGYGVGLLDTIGSMMQLLEDSPWSITDPAQTNVFRWVFDAYAPFIVKGSAMDMTSGRYPTRNGDNHARGHELLGAILRVAQVAPPADASAIKSFVKATIQSDTSLNFLNTQFPPYNVWASEILNDTNVVPRLELMEHRQFPGMDRVVHRTPNWTFGLSMSSKRVANYESTRGENLHGWFTGEGMTYLYNNDLTHYADNFWATVDPYRLAGTTVDTVTRTNGMGEGYNSPNTHTGGASILGRYGVAVMHLNAYGTDNMSARNSWFMFDNEIVCVGNSVGSSFGRETIIENRRLSVYGNNPFTVNGVAKPTGPGWSETIGVTSWAHLAGSSPGSDIGYYFPVATTVKALRESRSGRFYDVNTTYGSKTFSTGNYLTMYLDHGTNSTSATYSYVLLPGMSATQVAAYVASPEITVVQNNSTTTTVKKNKLGITAVNFWKDSSNQISGISSDRKAAVILCNDGNVLDIGMSEPTQTNTAGLRIEINTPALSILSLDPDISVLQLTPTIKLFLNTTNRFGATLNAKFLMHAAGQRPSITLSTPCDKNMDAPATVTLNANAQDPDGTIARLDFYRGPVLIAQMTEPQSSVATFTDFDLPQGTHNFSVVAVDNSGLTATSGPVSISVHTPRAAGTGTGLVGQYFKDQNEFRVLALTRTDTNVNIYWPDRESHPIPFSDHISVRWAGKVQTQRSGLHYFHAVSDDAVRLWIDGRLVIDHWTPHSETEDTGSISLAAGQYYTIAMEYYDISSPAVARLSWTQPRGAKEIVPQSQLYPADQGLHAIYFRGTTLTPSSAQRTRIDETVNFAWGTNSPEPTFVGWPFSARWEGRIKANAAGEYKFFTTSDDAVRLFIDDQLIVNNWTPHALTENSNTIIFPVAGQFYDLSMEFFNASGNGTAILSWQPPGEAKQVIPASNLTPHQNNNPPSLAPIINFVAARGGTVSFTASASEPDAPIQSLSFSLDANSPPGASINPSNGAFTWTIPNDQPFGPLQFAVRVADNGLPQMSDAQMVTATVLTNPTLSFARTPGFVRFTWPESATSVQLCCASNLAPPVTWLPLTNEAFLSNGEWAVETPASSNVMQFFRLGPRE